MVEGRGGWGLRIAREGISDRGEGRRGKRGSNREVSGRARSWEMTVRHGHRYSKFHPSEALTLPIGRAV